jgi:hypothetical protein
MREAAEGPWGGGLAADRFFVTGPCGAGRSLLAAKQSVCACERDAAGARNKTSL